MPASSEQLVAAFDGMSEADCRPALTVSMAKRVGRDLDGRVNLSDKIVASPRSRAMQPHDVYCLTALWYLRKPLSNEVLRWRAALMRFCLILVGSSLT